MEYFFSIIIPTRDRPEFIRESLKYISLQSYKNFEVIVSDNYSEDAFSCRDYFEKAKIPNSKYIRPATLMGMVENWNFALRAATGDYFIYLTDKMFLLPNTLYNLNEALTENETDIVSWVDDIFTPKNTADYFSEGFYFPAKTSVPTNQKFIDFSPIAELSKKGIADISRYRQDKSAYSRGKICFGAYSKELVQRVQIKYEKLFYNICPDYTSMILALSEAQTAIELKNPGIVHINTNISNGGLAALNDDFALGYLKSLENFDDLGKSMLVNYLYSSSHNMVSHDYLFLKNKFSLPFEFNQFNWLRHIYEDLYFQPRKWSNIFKEYEQKGYFISYFNLLSEEQKSSFNEQIIKLNNSYMEKNEVISDNELKSNTGNNLFKELAKFIIPYGILCIYLKKKKKLETQKPLQGYFNSLEEAVMQTGNY